MYARCHCKVFFDEWADIVKSLKQLRGIETFSLRIEGVKCAYARNRLKAIPADEDAIRQQIARPRSSDTSVTSHIARQHKLGKGSVDDDV